MTEELQNRGGDLNLDIYFFLLSIVTMVLYVSGLRGLWEEWCSKTHRATWTHGDKHGLLVASVAE